MDFAENAHRAAIEMAEGSICDQRVGVRFAASNSALWVGGLPPNWNNDRLLETFTFFGGHDPEDAEHQIGDPTTDLDLHPSSPGYRLILNNVLFPAAKKKQLKT